MRMDETGWSMVIGGGIICLLACYAGVPELIAKGYIKTGYSLMLVVVLLFGLPLIFTPIFVARAESGEDKRNAERKIREVKTNAEVEEIKLRHQLAMDRLKLEQKRINRELSNIIEEETVSQ